jgi:hypothetical protein
MRPVLKQPDYNFHTESGLPGRFSVCLEQRGNIVLDGLHQDLHIISNGNIKINNFIFSKKKEF